MTFEVLVDEEHLCNFVLCPSCCWKYCEGWLLQRNGAVGFVNVFASPCRIGMMGVAEEKIEFLGRPGRFIRESLQARLTCTRRVVKHFQYSLHSSSKTRMAMRVLSRCNNLRSRAKVVQSLSLDHSLLTPE